MSKLIDKIIEKREDIILGEIGALLHDIGKCRADFIKQQSIDKPANKYVNHEKIDEFLDTNLINLLKDNKSKIQINNESTFIYNLIKDHHSKNGDFTIQLKKCDKFNSADDKGAVRKKQSYKDTMICTPFGLNKEKIDLVKLDKSFHELKEELKKVFIKYQNGTSNFKSFRNDIINKIKKPFKCALGETRIPANDVTLWDHSFSTASLFKSSLCTMIINQKNTATEEFRIIGFCWNGYSFIKKGKKIADILSRINIITNIIRALKNQFELEIPIGNHIFEDINGIYFSFPNPQVDISTKLAIECSEIALEIIREHSNNELWPFFSLSKPSRTMTLIANEIAFLKEINIYNKISPNLFVKNSCKMEKVTIDVNSQLPQLRKKEDICPSCYFRSKPVVYEICQICYDRKISRIKEWLKHDENTIWIDEVADSNNRFALLSLEFILHNWLNGKMFETIYSQTFSDWMKDIKNNSSVNFLDEFEKKSNRKFKTENAEKIAKELLDFLTKSDELENKDLNTKILNSFIPDVRVKKNEYSKVQKNIINRLNPNEFNTKNLASWLFTQNATPARLLRLLEETSIFFDLVIENIKTDFYKGKKYRIKFTVDTKNNKEKIKGNHFKENTTYIIKTKKMKPDILVLLHTRNGEFYTIESLEKMKFENWTGKEAVIKVIENGISYIALEDEPNKNLFKEDLIVKIEKNSTKVCNYIPIIKIIKNPYSLKLLIPAADSAQILKRVFEKYNEKFKFVIGKLPLNVSLIISKRKFPLYITMDASERMLKDETFQQPVVMKPWWEKRKEESQDKYFGYYPCKRFDANQRLDPFNDIKNFDTSDFYLYPGYFDFNFLLSTTDRYKIGYDNNTRIDCDYKILTNRPYYFHTIIDMIDLWNELSLRLSNSQIFTIKEMLTRKAIEWKHVIDSNKDEVFKEYALSVLKNAFSEKWAKLPKSIKNNLLEAANTGLLSDIIDFFVQNIKINEVENIV